MRTHFAGVRLVQRVTSGYSGAGGRFPAIFGMPVSPIVTAIGSDGRAETGSEIGSPSSRVLHELSRLAHEEIVEQQEIGNQQDERGGLPAHDRVMQDRGTLGRREWPRIGLLQR